MATESTAKGLSATFRTLAAAGTSSALKVLEVALRENSPHVQHGAVSALLSDHRRSHALLLARNYQHLPEELRAEIRHAKHSLAAVLGEIMARGQEHERVSAVELVKDLNDTRSAKLVVLALADISQRIREKARATLARMVWTATSAPQTSPQDRAQLLTALIEGMNRLPQDQDPLIIGCMVKLDSSETSPVLKMAASTAEDRRRRVLRFLADTDLPEVRNLILEMLQSESSRARNAALWALRFKKDPDFINQFVNKLSASPTPLLETFLPFSQSIPWCSPHSDLHRKLDPKVQTWLLSLRSQGAQGVVPVDRVTTSSGVLSRVSINERNRLLRSLRDIRNPNEMAILKEGLADPNEQVQRLAVEKLVEMKHPNRDRLLLAQVTTPFPDVRRAALAALGQSVFASYFRSFDRLTPHLRRQAARALAKLDPNLIAELNGELASADPERRLKALLITIAAGKEKQLDRPILRLATDENGRVRATAVGMLGRISTEETIKALITGLADPDNRVKANAVSAIGLIGRGQFAKIVRPFLESSNNRIRANAGVAMAQLGYEKEGLRTLGEMAGDPRDVFRASAAWGLGQVVGEDVDLTLKKLAYEDDMENVRRMATRMLHERQAQAKVTENVGEDL